MRKSFCYKLYSAKKNKLLHHKIDMAAQAYNYCLSLHKTYYRLFKKHLNKYKLQKYLTRVKKKHSFLNQLGSQAVQDITDRLQRSYELFYQNLKKNTKAAPPRFKKRIRYKSFTLKQAGYKFLEGNSLRIDKTTYKFFNSREIEGTVKTLTIKRDALGDIYIFLSCFVEKEKPNKTMTGKIAGFDFGLKTFLTSSEATEDIESPLFFKKSLKKIRKSNRSLSKKKRGSNNRKKALKCLFRSHKKILNQRKDYQFKLANELSDKYDILCFETLNINALKRKWGRKVSDLSFSSFLRILEYYCEKKGSKIIYIDPFYPSSKTCYHCNEKNEELTLKERDWICPYCSKKLMRDKNAARNIKRQGIVLWNRECKTYKKAIPA